MIRLERDRPAPLGALVVGLLMAAAGCAETPPARPDATRPATTAPVISAAVARAPGDLQVGPGDRIAVTIRGLFDGGRPETFELQVLGSGLVHVPFAGSIKAAGATTDELSERIASSFGQRRFVKYPAVSVVVVESAQLVGVTGAVVKGGLVRLDRPSMTLQEVLAFAGGVTLEAGTHAFVETPDGSRLVVRLDDRSARSPVIAAGSSVHVPAGDPIYVKGWVTQPGSYRPTRGMTLSQAVAAAGGVRHEGSTSELHLRRMEPGGVTVRTFDLDELSEDAASDVEVLPGDVVEVGRTALWAAFTEGLEILRGVARFGIGASVF
ncbi:MAG: SLBB domain-containing protein [Planctomycetota bacterium]